MTPQEYKELANKRAPKTKFWRNMFFAYIVGGAICTVGQILLELYKRFGEKTASGWTSVTLIFLAALFTAFHVYDKLAKWAGGGTLVPITGFSNAITSAAMEFKSEGFVAGTGAKMFSVAGPVIVYGVLASVVYGVVLLCLR